MAAHIQRLRLRPAGRGQGLSCPGRAPHPHPPPPTVVLKAPHQALHTHCLTGRVRAGRAGLCGTKVQGGGPGGAGLGPSGGERDLWLPLAARGHSPPPGRPGGCLGSCLWRCRAVGYQGVHSPRGLFCRSWVGGRPDAVVLRGAVPQVRWGEGGGGSSFCLRTLSDGLLSPSTDGAGAEASGCLPCPASSQAGGFSAPHSPIHGAEPVTLRGPPSLCPGRPAEV